MSHPCPLKTDYDINQLYVIKLSNDVTTASMRIGGVMVRVLASSVVDHGFEPRLRQTQRL